MHQLQALLAFSETAKRGSFAAAARDIGAVPSTVAKAVTRLELSLGLRLFHRSTRQVSLTPDGERLFARCQRVLAEVEALHADAAGTRAAPGGSLRIDVPVVLGRRVVVPMLADLAARHPALDLDVRLSDAYADLVKDGVDLALRIGELADSRLVARRVGSQDWVLCAAPAYLARKGVPRSVRALVSHDAVVFRLPTSGRDQAWRFGAGAKATTFQPAARFRFTDGEAMGDAARLGLGIAQLPDYMVAAELAAGSLVELLPRQRPPATPIHAVMPAQRLVPTRVRVVLEALGRLPLGLRQGSRGGAA